MEKCKWYNEDGFYSEFIIEDKLSGAIYFVLDDEDIENATTGKWSMLIYIDDYLAIHKTFQIH